MSRVSKPAVALLLAGSAVWALSTAAPAVAAPPGGGGCATPSAPSDVFKSISTHTTGSSNQGTSCNDANGQADYPITGWIAYNPGAGTTVQLGDFYEGLSTHHFYWGVYSLTFGACTDGTAAAGSYNVTQNTGSYPQTMPTFTGTLATITGGADGNAICPYSLTVQNAPSGHLNSSKNDLWIAVNNQPLQGHHTATQSVGPPNLPQGGNVPEVPTVALLVGAGALSVALVSVRRMKRSQRGQAPVAQRKRG